MKGNLNLGGRLVPYELTYKTVKNVNIRVRPNGTVSVSANRRVSQAQVEAILTSRGDFILKALDRFAQAPGPCTCSDGETLWLLGKPYPLRVQTGTKNQAVLAGDRILLTVKDPEDQTLREKTVEALYKDQCLRLTTRLVREIQPSLHLFRVPVPEVKVRAMTSRWGSCKPTAQRVTFASRLVEAPLACVEYVVWHELVHFIHPNHSADFYGVLAAFLPDWKARRELLNSCRYRQTT